TIEEMGIGMYIPKKLTAVVICYGNPKVFLSVIRIIHRGGQIISDNAQGSIVCWVDLRNGLRNLYIQQVNSSGQRLWLNQGVPLCITDSVYWYQRFRSDNHSGAIIAWQDKRSGNYDIYAQHVDSSGNVKWQTNGMVVCTTTYDQQSPEMAPSDSNTAIIIWSDARSGYYRGYVQRVGDDPNGIEEMQNEKLQIAN
ncbi:MAG: TolB-like translocation protein, partial [Desulfocucumaceae bacterium]